ncbi:MAG TPA: AAA family ATPase [Novosphingobium sp.]
MADPFASVPDDNEPEDLHRRFTAWLARDVLGLTCDAVFTSEDYGDGFARVLAQAFGHEVTHVCVDKPRCAVPISATAIRQDLHLRRDFLPPVVAADLPTRLVVLGAEATGKSTLCAALGARWREPVADEFGRELWLAKDGKLTLSDMLKIAKTQIAREDHLLTEARRALICDTSPLTTAFFSQEMFGEVVLELQRLARREYDLTFLCMPDFPFVQDGTRQDEDFRKTLHATYVAHLTSHGIPFVPLSGGIQDRLETIENNLGLALQSH